MSQNVVVPEDDLSPRQISILPLLLRPATISEHAREAGITLRTLQRWLQDDTFRRHLEVMRHRAAQLAESDLLALSNKAVEVIFECLHNDSPQIRLHAAKAVIQLNTQVQYGKGLEQRLEHKLQIRESVERRAPWSQFPPTNP